MIRRMALWAFLALGFCALLGLLAVPLSRAADKASDPELQDVKDKTVKKGDKGVDPEKPKIDWENDDQLEKKNWENREDLTTKWKITSMTLKPPCNAKGEETFKTFPDGPGEYVEVVVGDGQEWAVIPKEPPEKNIQFWGTVAKNSADLWPLKSEGNLKPPPGGEGGDGTKDYHWSAKISNEEVIFDPNPVKTGYALKDDGTPDPKKIKQPVTATFSPKSLAADAKIVVDDPHSRIEPIAEEDLTRDAGTGTIKFDVYGKGPNFTPPDVPNGDVTIKATKADDTPLKSEAKVIVVIPSTQVHEKVAIVLVNTAVNLPNDKFELSTRGFVFIDIFVKNQFGNPLDAVYNGNGVVVEEFVNRQGDEFQWPDKGPIEDPDPALVNGLKHDVASDRCKTESPGQLSPEQILAWENFEFLLGGKDNCFALNGQQLEASAGQKIWVQGHELSNIVTRTITEKPVNREDVPFDVEDD
ncbi:MAG: hypothetical protein WBD63_03110 [Phycisphaerae bacterium]|nr:hypothetical protein [Phycisphaerae bacterium]